MGADAVRSGCARLLIHQQKSGNDYEKCVHAQGKGELAWDIWPNRLVLRLPLQSENETNVPLKSGPALAGPAGSATPPLHHIARKETNLAPTYMKQDRTGQLANNLLSRYKTKARNPMNESRGVLGLVLSLLNQCSLK